MLMEFPAQQLASQFGKKLSSNWKNRTLKSSTGKSDSSSQ